MSGKTHGRWRVVLKRRKRLSPSSWLLVFARPADFPDPAPGQFLSIRAAETIAPLLRRPYSILDCTPAALSILVKVVGRGSAALADVRPGSAVDIIGPLGGAAFPDPAADSAVLVAGGTGLAPILFAARNWRRGRIAARTTLLYGASDRLELLRELTAEEFSARRFATLDGSAGFRGDVVSLCRDLIVKNRLPAGVLYSCGPRGMVRALVKAVGSHFKAHYTSLETVMACGVGACRGCTVPVRDGRGRVPRAVCSDGTVFSAEDIAWEEWEE